MKPSQKYILAFIFLFSQFSNGNCQSPYQLKSSREFILSGASVGVSLSGFLLLVNKRKLTVEEILKLEPATINLFDRSAVNYYSHSASTASDMLLLTCIFSPFALLIDKNIRNNSLQNGVMYFEALAIASAGFELAKGFMSRPRPYVYNNSVPKSEKQKRDATNSFFSGHTAMSAAASFFAAKVFSNYNPDSKWKLVVWIGASAIPLATGYSRYRAGKHFPSELIIGYCWGTLCGILIPKLHQQK